MSQIIEHNFKNNSFEGKFNEIYFSSLTVNHPYS